MDTHEEGPVEPDDKPDPDAELLEEAGRVLDGAQNQVEADLDLAEKTNIPWETIEAVRTHSTEVPWSDEDQARLQEEIPPPVEALEGRPAERRGRRRRAEARVIAGQAAAALRPPVALVRELGSPGGACAYTPAAPASRGLRVHIWYTPARAFPGT